MNTESQQFLDDIQNAIDGIEEMLYNKQVTTEEAINCADRVSEKLTLMYKCIAANCVRPPPAVYVN